MPDDFSILSNKTSLSSKCLRICWLCTWSIQKNQNVVKVKDVYLALESAGIQSADQPATRSRAPAEVPQGEFIWPVEEEWFIMTIQCSWDQASSLNGQKCEEKRFGLSIAQLGDHRDPVSTSGGLKWVWIKLMRYHASTYSCSFKKQSYLVMVKTWVWKWTLMLWKCFVSKFLVADTYVSWSVCQSVGNKNKIWAFFCYSAPAHPSATWGECIGPCFLRGGETFTIKT